MNDTRYTLALVAAFGVPLAIIAWPFLPAGATAALAAVTLAAGLGIVGYLATCVLYGLACGVALGLKATRGHDGAAR